MMNGKAYQDAKTKAPSSNGENQVSAIHDELDDVAVAFAGGEDISVNQASRSLLRPAIFMMNKLLYPQKFTLIGLLLMLPLAWVLIQYVVAANNDIAFSSREQLGVEYLAPASQLLQNVQKHMAMSDAALHGDTSYQDDMTNLETVIDQNIREINEIDSRLGSRLNVTSYWEALKTEWAQLLVDSPTLTQQQNLDRHITLLNHIQDFIVVVGNNSNLILDPDIDTYYLMDTVIIQIPRATTYYSLARVYGLESALSEDVSPASQTRLAVFAQFAQSTVEANQRGLQYAFDYNAQLRTAMSGDFSAHLDSLAEFDKLIAANSSLLAVNPVGPASASATATEIFTTATRAIDREFELYDLALEQLAGLIQTRINRFTLERNVAVIVALAALLATIYMFWGFYWSVRDVITSLKSYSEQGLARRQDAPDLVPENRDELAQGVRSMASQLRVAFSALANSVEEARRATTIAEEASRLKSEFLATMSHELRTPLNAMIGFSEIMLAGMGGQVDDDARGMVERIHANSQRLLTLINDILDLSRIEAHRHEIVDRAFSARETIANLCSSMQSLADKKQIGFEYWTDPALPEEMMADPDVLERIITNLLSNAFKFTHAGKVKLDALRSKDRDEWTITVTDTGIGIPPHAKEYIFDPFRQVDGTSRRAYGGTGLGLAIVKELVRAIGGSIKLESAVGYGTTFVVALPLIVQNADTKEPVLA